MCGIAGIFTVERPVDAGLVVAVLRMLDAQVHRGPDDWALLLPDLALENSQIRALLEPRGWDHVRTYPGSVSAPAAVLGTCRLSIIDLSRCGRMPMGSADGRIWLAHNGEIYNYRELRPELEQRGYAFHSDSDTETILHGYEEWGEEVFDHLHGMFAFALFATSPLTPSASKLILARDRFGIKPLYYYQDRDTIVFASEVRAMMRTGMVPDERSVEALVRFLQLGSVPVPLTTVRNVLALPAGNYLVTNQLGPRVKQYWDLSTSLTRSSHLHESSSFEQAVTTTRSLLEESVKLHLISDVPLGVFLSGGIDSSALVALASRFRDKPLTTLSIVFEEPEYSEVQYARLVAKRHQTDHHEVLLRSEDFLEELPRIFASMDQPTTDGVNSYFVSRAAKHKGLTVVLSGTGGDEVFLGYDHFRKANALDGLRHIFGRLPIQAQRGFITIAIRTGILGRRSGLARLAYLERPSDENVYLLFRGLFAPRQIQDLLGIGEEQFDGFGPIFKSLDYSTSQSLIDSFTLLEFNHYLQNQLLKDTDFMSMAHSIETRVPYLDHRLVEQALHIPPARRLANGINKPLLVKALGDDLPKEVWDRPKMTFTLPFEAWMEDRADDLQACSREEMFLDRKAVEGIWKGFRGGRVHWSRPWATVVAAHFHQAG